MNAVLNRLTRPKGRRRGARQFMRVTLADRGRRRRRRGFVDVRIVELLGNYVWDRRSFL